MGLPWRLEIAEMRRVKAEKGSRRPEAHELGKPIPKVIGQTNVEVFRVRLALKDVKV